MKSPIHYFTELTDPRVMDATVEDAVRERDVRMDDSVRKLLAMVLSPEQISKATGLSIGRIGQIDKKTVMP